jgi:transposase-like protein
MLHRLRHASTTKAFNQPLKNVVEVDESYIGGKERNKHLSKRTKGSQGRSTKTRTPVLAIVERNGYVRAVVAPKVNQQTVGKFITDNVVFGTSVMSDEYKVYNAIQWLYKHGVVKHGTGQYVSGEVHTNTIEGYFSLLKRGIIGIYHFVSAKHLAKYLDEFSFRYNTKGDSEDVRFDLLLRSCDAKRLTYKQLIANHV